MMLQYMAIQGMEGMGEQTVLAVAGLLFASLLGKPAQIAAISPHLG